MLSHIEFIKKYPLTSVNLSLTCISLEKWAFVKIHGKDTVQYLHNQLTCDIKNLKKHQYSFAAHCNSIGKMISNMYVFYLNSQEMAFIQRLDICNEQIKKMEKYAIFSKVTIYRDCDVILVGIAGKNAKQYLNIFFSTLPNQTYTIIHNNNTTLLYFDKPTERFLLIITNISVLDHLLNQSKFDIQFNNSQQWITLDIEAGYPWIESVTSEMFIPQSVNMDILKGISFNKGCYIGQELITRMQYRGCNKQTLFQLTGTLSQKNNHQLPKPGENLILQINNQYLKYIGTILQTIQMTPNNIWVQAVLNKSILKYKKPDIKTSHTKQNLILC